jgi:hypothetical protein
LMVQALYLLFSPLKINGFAIKLFPSLGPC